MASKKLNATFVPVAVLASLGINRSENSLFNLFQETPIKNISLAKAKTGAYLKITPIEGVFVKIEVSLPKIL